MMEPSSSGSNDLYASLTFLAEEIRQGIFNLSDSTMGNKKDLCLKEMEKLKEISMRHRIPELEYNILLWRKYADVANEIKDSTKNDLFANFTGSQHISVVYERNDKELIGNGWAALKQHIFWLRLITAVFAFISCIIMSAVPHISSTYYNPSHQFSSSCASQYKAMQGTFNNQPYQYLIAVTVFLYVDNMIFALYYLMPVDTEGRKFIPGFEKLLSICMQPDKAQEMLVAYWTKFALISKTLELGSDLLLLFMGAIAFLVAAILVERGAEFSVGGVEQFYTRGTFYQTYHAVGCLDMDHSSLIRASIAMLFFALVGKVLCLLNSYKTFIRLSRESLSFSSSSSITPPSDRPPHISDFRSLPLATQGDDEEEEECTL